MTRPAKCTRRRASAASHFRKVKYGGYSMWFIYKSRHVNYGREQVVFRCKMENIIDTRSEEHTSELQSLMRISYAVFCLKKKTTNRDTIEDKKNRVKCKPQKRINRLQSYHKTINM